MHEVLDDLIEEFVDSILEILGELLEKYIDEIHDDKPAREM